ncbi:MAG: hypothetical protein KF850_33085 [Labilithrix sp.]|nr:hypothetical protein [Labilithrix sp.]
MVGDFVRHRTSGLAEITAIDDTEEYPIALRYKSRELDGATGGAKREDLTFVSRPEQRTEPAWRSPGVPAPTDSDRRRAKAWWHEYYKADGEDFSEGFSVDMADDQDVEDLATLIAAVRIDVHPAEPPRVTTRDVVMFEAGLAEARAQLEPRRASASTETPEERDQRLWEAGYETAKTERATAIRAACNLIQYLETTGKDQGLSPSHDRHVSTLRGALNLLPAGSNGAAEGEGR